MDLRASINGVVSKATGSRAFATPLLSLVRGAQQFDATKEIRITKLGVDRYTVEVMSVLDGTVFRTVNMGEIYGVAGAITNLAFSTSTYGQVKIDQLFILLYDVADRTVNYITGQGPGTKVESTMPCQICGVVLPVRNITVDHQRPQTGGALEAIAKTFRAFGLTKEGPKGEKGKKILAHMRTGSNVTAVPPQPGRVNDPGTSSDDRYALNDQGVILYSLVVGAGHLEQLKIACLHGLMNLKPACNSCNSSRGQQLKF